jgi:glycosyltransferase 2 family protein
MKAPFFLYNILDKSQFIYRNSRMRFSMKNWRTWLGRGVWLLLLAALLYWALRNAPLNEIWASLRQLESWQLSSLAGVNFVIIMLITVRWWLIVRVESEGIPLTPLIAYRLSVFGVSYFTPGPQVGGEPLQVIYLQRHYSVSYARATSAVFMDKLLEFLANFIFLAFGLFAVFRVGLISPSGLQVLGGLILAGLFLLWPLVHIILLYRGYYPVSNVFRAIQSRFGESKWLRLMVVAERMAGGFARRHLGTLLLALGVSLLAWVMMVGEYAMLLRFLHIPLDFWQMIASLTAVRLAFLLPLPGGLGALEAAQVFALSVFGFPAAVGMSLSLAMRGRDLFLGGLGLLLAGADTAR